MPELRHPFGIVGLIFVGVFVFQNKGAAHAQAAPPSDYTIRAPAPMGLTSSELGRPYSSNFRPLIGEAGMPLFPASKKRISESTEQFEYDIVAVSSSHELNANASGWGISGSLSVAGQDRYLAYRAMQITRIEEVNDRSAPRSTSPDASYYVRRIYYGRMVEYVCKGKASAFTAAVAADFGVAGGSIKGFEKKHHTRCRLKGKGLAPTDPAGALFATSVDEIKSSYQAVANEKPVPILVDYRRVPNANLTGYEQYAWQTTTTEKPAPIEMYVDASNGEWQDSGITLHDGDTVSIVPTGTVEISRQGKRATPGKMKFEGGKIKFAYGSLMMKIGPKESSRLHTGSAYAVQGSVDRYGSVKFKVLDSNHADNRGMYLVHLVHVPVGSQSPATCVGPGC